MRRLALWSSLFMALVWIGVGPRPADNAPYDGRDFQASTQQRLIDKAPALVEGDLKIGVAETDITPSIGHPLAGYGGRHPKASTAIDHPVYVRALTLSVDGQQVTILTADLLLINQKMAEAIYQRSGLKRAQLYITASHTHSGPGGWGERFIEELIFGEFDADYFEQLVDQFTATIQQSQQNLEPAELAVLQLEVAGSQLNRFADELPTHDPITALLFRAIDSQVDAPPEVIFTIFGAHPTILSVKTHTLSGDYPAQLNRRLKRLTGANMALFAAGSVGDAKPVKPPGETAIERAAKYGNQLAEQLASKIPTAVYQQQIALGTIDLIVDMPPIRYPISEAWTLGPLISGLFGDDESRLQGLRIGPLLLLGFPGDYAGHLATELFVAIKRQTQSPLLIATTSFNGNFDGYFVSHQVYESFDRAETRGLNFFGPWGGEYLNSIALEISKRLVRE